MSPLLTEFMLDGKVALITGAASGIGLATVKIFLNANAQGILLVDQSQDGLDKALSQIPSDKQDRCYTFVADVSSVDFKYADKALEIWGRLDIAVLNAGVCSNPTGILETNVQTWDKRMEVNARGVFLGIKQCGKAMLVNKKGSIVITASQLGLQGSPKMSAYSASKWAARGLALTAAEELTPLGIRVNSVCPGPTITPLIDTPEGREDWPRMAELTLMKRMGEAGEIANAILYLASDASSFCSGTTLKVDGGYAKFG